MEPLLFLVHRIPYPPNKGDKIRSWNFLKYLADKYRIYLGAFIDDPNDWQYVNVLKDICQDTCLLGINPKLKKIQSLSALFTGEALSIPYYRHKTMSKWVYNTMARENIKRVFVYSSQLAQYVMDTSDDINRVIDYVDIDSDKWLQYGKSHIGPLGWIYTREGEHLFDYEKQIIDRFNTGVFVSSDEAKLFKSLISNHQEKITFISNGVKSDFFNPNEDYVNPYNEEDKILVFTGAMDYWANVDAVTWFANEVFSQVLKTLPEAKFYIVGSNPIKAVQELTALKNVYVTGSVDDIRPYIHHATASVAPLRIARGLQNKVLEAMAMAKPILASPMAMEGINADEGLAVICKDASEYIQKTCELLKSTSKDDLNHAARTYVKNNFSWQINLKQLDKLFE